MKKFLLLQFFLCSVIGYTQSLNNSLSNKFDQAYITYPSVPKGILEAVAYTKTRMQHIDPLTEPESCAGLPKVGGIMGLTIDGKGYFKNVLDLVSMKSGYSKAYILQSEQNTIQAYAKAFTIIQNELGIISDNISNNILPLRYLSELPANTLQEQYAQDTELYGILTLLNDPVFMQKFGYKPYHVKLNNIFGQSNYAVLSSKKVVISGKTITGSNNKVYQGQYKQACLDYPSAIWVAADLSNYSSRGGTPISAVTIHTIQGSYSGAISWFQNPNSNVSSHYVLRSSDGQVTQMVCESDKAWHVGSGNPYTIGLEHEGYVSNPAWYTTAMYISSADVCADIVNSGYGINPLRTAFWPWTSTTNYNSSGIPGSCSKIKGHQHFPNQTHTDPGQYWDWDYFYKLINDPPPTTTNTTCTGSFNDSGGSGSDYGNDERNLTVISPSNASSVTITFNDFNLELDWDYMYIYDGNSVWAPLIGYYTGTNNPGTITSNGGALAIEFRSDCATTSSGWTANWTCTTTINAPSNLQSIIPTCSNTDYTADLTWDNADSGWYLDISTDSSFSTYWNKPIDWLTTTSASANFLDPFNLGPLVLQADTVYHWRIWNGTTWYNGTPFSVPFCPDTIIPTSSASNPNTWETADFTASFTDFDTGGSGLDLSFYQVLDYNGAEWRANNGNGFYNDNFDLSIHPDWTISTGTWSISSGYLNQSDEGLNQTNMNTSLNQVSSEIYLYHYQANIQSGISSNRRQGIHFFADNGTLPNGGNSYFVYFRVDDNSCQIYKVANDVWTLKKDTALIINENTWYDHKILFNPLSGEIKVYVNNVFISEWTDTSPHISGNSVLLRTGNANVLFNDFKTYRVRSNTELITIGPDSTNDVRFQNPDPSTPSCRIKTIVKDNAENWSLPGSLNVNIDWTIPSDVAVNDGISNDVDTICTLSELSANWTASIDTHSAVVRYWYAIGTAPGGNNIINWIDNGQNTSVTQTGLTLNADTIYYFTIRAENGAGLFSNDISSDGQVPKIMQINAFADTTELTLPDSTIIFTDTSANAVAWSWTFPGGIPSSSTSQVQPVVYNVAGTYDFSLSVTNIYGCTDSIYAASYIVVNDPPPAPAIAGFTSNITSGCEPLIINFIDASSNAPDTWLWLLPGADTSSSTLQNPTVTYINPGIYTVTLIVSNFFGTDTLIMTDYITVYEIPTASVPSDQFICESESVILSASGGTNYLWSTGQTDSVITVTPDSTTTYTVVASENGCNSQPATVTVNVTDFPTSSISTDQTICFGDSVQLIITGGTSYLWNTGDTTATITVGGTTPPATYMVIISKDACTEIDTQYTTVTTIQLPIADFTASDTIAELQNAAITFYNNSSSANQFTWDFGDGNTSISTSPYNTYADTGWYTVSLIAENPYCTKDTLVQTNYIHIIPNLPIADFIVIAETICITDSVQFINNSTNANSYLWLLPGGDPSSSILQNPKAKYDSSSIYSQTLIAIGPGGSDTLIKSTLITLKEVPAANLSTDDTLLILPNAIATFTNSSINADTYFWDFGDGNTSADINPWNLYPGIGSYTVTLVAMNGVCPNDTIILEELIRIENGVNIWEYKDIDPKVFIYPVPAHNEITIYSARHIPAKISLINTMGQMIFELKPISKTHTIDLSNYPGGEYIIRIIIAKDEINRKIIISK